MGKHQMRIAPSIILAAFATMAALPASAQVFVTGITAAVPDPPGKVPAFNAVPGAGITTWSNGVAQAVLTAGQTYNYCVSAASAWDGTVTAGLIRKLLSSRKYSLGIIAISDLQVARAVDRSIEFM